MANEITLDGSLVYEDAYGKKGSLQLFATLASVVTRRIVRLIQSIGTTEEAMILGDVSGLGWCMIVNRDATNFVEVRTGTSGTKFCKIPPLKFALFFFGSDVTAPFLIADTAAVEVDIFLCSI